MSEHKNRGPSNKSREQLSRCTRDRQIRIEKVAELYLRGSSFRAIASECNVSVAQVTRDLAVVRAAWLNETRESLASLLAEELARLHAVEREAWAGWAKSQEVKVETLSEKGEGSSGVFSKRQVRKTQLHGTPDFLKVVLRSIEQRMKILIAMKEESGESDDIIVPAVEVIVESREQAQQMLKFEEFRKIMKQ